MPSGTVAKNITDTPLGPALIETHLSFPRISAPSAQLYHYKTLKNFVPLTGQLPNCI